MLIDSLIDSLMHSFSCTHDSPMHSFVRSVVGSFMHSFIHLSIHSFPHPSILSFLYSDLFISDLILAPPPPPSHPPLPHYIYNLIFQPSSSIVGHDVKGRTVNNLYSTLSEHTGKKATIQYVRGPTNPKTIHG